MLGCGCVFLLVAAAAPRLALIFLWVFTDWVGRAFESAIVPLLGLIFLPYTALFYLVVWDPARGVNDTEWIWLGLGVLIDIARWASVVRARHDLPGYPARN